MHYAAKSPFSSMNEADEMMTFLLKSHNHQSVARINKNNESPLHFACEGGSFFGVQWLVSHEAEIECNDENGFTPFLKCGQSYFETEAKIKFLIEKRVSIDAKTKRDQNILHLLAERGHRSPSFLTFLVDKGADVFLKDSNGLRPHELASGEQGRVFLSEYTRKSELRRNFQEYDPKVVGKSFLPLSKNPKVTTDASMLTKRDDVFPLNSETVSNNLINALVKAGALHWKEIAMCLLNNMECKKSLEWYGSSKTSLQAVLEEWRSDETKGTKKVGQILAIYDRIGISRTKIERLYIEKLAAQ
eukprot:m.214833 g.214833  ORF g.214833 m.214833 type:complete len:302 (+) comp39819_c1_seq1:209-1114(+)